jgi:hypothetical protein
MHIDDAHRMLELLREELAIQNRVLGDTLDDFIDRSTGLVERLEALQEKHAAPTITADPSLADIDWPKAVADYKLAHGRGPKWWRRLRHRCRS